MAKTRQASNSETLLDQGKKIQIQIKCAFSKMESIADLKPHPKNPREHSKRQIKTLAEAIKRNGFRRPIIVSSLSKVIIAGHGTCEAAKLLEMERVPVDYQEFNTTADEAAFLVSDNHIARMGTTDSKMVAEIMQDFGGIDLESFGFNESERLSFYDQPSQDNGDNKKKPDKKTTKNGLAVSEKDESEQPTLIVATITKEAGRKFSAWKQSNKVADDNEALTIILNQLQP